MTDERLTWNSPETVPDVPLGKESEFWIAVDSAYSGKTHVFPAQYQNRPLRLDDDGEPLDDWALVSPMESWISSVGWVLENIEFPECYVPIHFEEKYVLLGWAEYTPPEFTGVTPPTRR